MKSILKLLCISVTSTTLLIALYTWHGGSKDIELLSRTAQELLEIDRIPRESMILSMSYWEQTSNAMRNLFDLQCWASTVNITKVVEPAVFSLPGKTLHFSSQPNATFRDYFDFSFWNSMASQLNQSILVSLETFLKYSYKDIIYVQLQFKKRDVCKSVEELAEAEWFRFLVSKNFHIKTTCIYVKFPIPDDVLQVAIFSSFNYSSLVSIFFEEWRGIGTKTFRLRLKNSRCQAGFSKLVNPHFKSTEHKKITYPSFPKTPVVYSKKILKYRDNFVSRYLQGTKYVAIMVRAEKLDYSVISSELNENSCIKEVLADKKNALSLAKARRTLFFTDVGVHGSSAWSYLIKKRSAASDFSRYLENSLDPFYSSEELNIQLERITKSNDSILIALLQSAVAASADAIVLVGGASFQIQTLNIYAHNHRGHEKYFLRDSQCVRKYISGFKW